MKEILLGILCIVIMLVSLFAPIMLIPFVTKLIPFVIKMIEWISNKVNQLLDWICSCIKSVCYFIIERNKIQKKLALVIIVVIVIGLCFGPSVIMPSVMKYPHNLVQSFSSDVIENESNVLRRNINDTVENVNIDIKQSNENVEKKEDYIKKEYLDSATYSYNVVNTISGILTPLFSLLAVIAAFVTLYRQRKQNAIQNFENHLFQMIDQQHKLEEKVVNKHGSFRDLYRYFCVIYVYVNERVDVHFKENKKKKEIKLKIANYIFYFGADKDFLCDKTFDILTDGNLEYKLDKVKLRELIGELNGKKVTVGINNDLFHTQKSEELGIYYRNLFNAIRYIDWECPEEDKKEYYAKLVRTNLSDFAQLMLYYNMQGKRGEAWLDEKEVKNPKHTYSVKKNGKRVDIKDCLLTRYLPIKNCAISVKNKDIDPRKDGMTDLFSDDVIHYELKY